MKINELIGSKANFLKCLFLSVALLIAALLVGKLERVDGRPYDGVFHEITIALLSYFAGGFVFGYAMARVRWLSIVYDPADLRRLLNEYLVNHTPDCARSWYKGEIGAVATEILVKVATRDSNMDQAFRNLSEGCIAGVVNQAEKAESKASKMVEELNPIIEAGNVIRSIKAATNEAISDSIRQRQRLESIHYEMLDRLEKKQLTTPTEQKSSDCVDLPTNSETQKATEQITAVSPEELAKKLDLEFIDLSAVAPSEAIINGFPGQAAHWYRVFPVRMDSETIVVAMADPAGPRTCDDLVQLLRQPVRLAVADPDLVQGLIDKYYAACDTSIESLLVEQEKKSEVD